ncbi:DUF6062 family protein [Clostridium minihomine]|uniref:DUF6062 family protein n=1 Tax=Clostridium minihomine TaxID=2045012 RepID=UPI00101AD93E|nr:DUF6062 family protein [Clostridium minihomine]
MRQDITTIPISEVFEPRQGCPICRMQKMLEEHLTEYITGAAMMEPDVREQTNRLGFCAIHWEKTRQTGSRLSVALILESHLTQLTEQLFTQSRLSEKKRLQLAQNQQTSCFLCEKTEQSLSHLLETVYALWGKEETFRSLYTQQEFLCLPHYTRLMQESQKVSRDQRQFFREATTRLAQNQLTCLSQDITKFCAMFDYRNKNGDWGNSRDAIERSIAFLTADAVTKKEEP